MRREEVLIRRWPHDDIPPEYFHLVDGSLPLTFEACGHAYEQDELKMVGDENSVHVLRERCLMSPNTIHTRHSDLPTCAAVGGAAWVQTFLLSA